MNFTDPTYDDIIFSIKLFQIISVRNFEPMIYDLGYSGIHNPHIHEIARDFLRQILPLNNEQIIHPKSYIRKDLQMTDMLESWTNAFAQLDYFKQASTIFEWFSRVEHQWKHRDNRLDVISSWNMTFYKWCIAPDTYPVLPFNQITIQKLRIELLKYRIQLAELSPRINSCIRSADEDDEWDEILSNDDGIHTWIHNIARQNYSVEKWHSIFTILSDDDLQILEDTWIEAIKIQDVVNDYFSPIKLKDWCQENNYL